MTDDQKVMYLVPPETPDPSVEQVIAQAQALQFALNG